MPAGIGLSISYDPPGAIGIVLSDKPGVLIMFDEATTPERPRDAAGALFDLNAGTVVTAGVLMTMPAVTAGVLGNARTFTASGGGIAQKGLVTSDIVTGTTLFTRDLTIMTIIAIDVNGQSAASGTGTIIKRGLAYKLNIGIVDMASRLCQIQGDAGPTMMFTAPPGFTMLTWTRRWVSPTVVVSRYYIGDVLIGEGTSATSPSGATVDPTFIAFGQSTGLDPFVGAIDQIAVFGREMSREEIQATWLRIVAYQPLGVALFKDSHDKGFPMPLDPSSEVQRENRLVGAVLGYAAAQIENMRKNMLPQRAYGQVLADWETVTRPTAQPGDSIDQRRARVLARIRQRRGVSIGGLQDALEGLLGGADMAQLEFLAFTNTITDDFTTLNLSRWDVTPVGSTAAASGKARVTSGAGTFIAPADWRTCAAAVGGDGDDAHIIAKLVWTTPQANGETGVLFGDAGLGNYLLLGLRNLGGSFRVMTESYIAGVSAGAAVVQQILGANPAAIWFHLWQTDTPGSWLAAWSVTSATAGYTTSTVISHPTLQNRAGFYTRSTGAIGSSVSDFDDLILRAPGGTRPFNAYVLLDSALGFDPDVDGATSVIKAIKHAYTHACFIESRNLLCDTPFGCDSGPMGGI